MLKKIMSMLVISIVLTSCNSEKTSVLEVTTFTLNNDANPQNFNDLDAEVEENFTRHQPGFIKRESGVNEKGEYVVIVYWDTQENADASMQKFMGDSSVANYAGMIDAASMQMNRYDVVQSNNNDKSTFIEVMSFNVKEDVNQQTFDSTNKAVETSFTSKQTGFVKRVTGENQKLSQVVVVYWDTRDHSNAALQPFMEQEISKDFMSMMDANSIKMGRYQTLTSLKDDPFPLTNKQKAVALLNSFNMGDTTPISYINPQKYIQHNLAVGDGLAGFGKVMKNAPEGGFKANVIRAFQDGAYVFTHTEYDFFGPKAGFDVFRFEEGRIVEHWDNLIEVQPANPSGRTQFDGTTQITDLDKTETNKNVVRNFIEKVLLNGAMDQVSTYINPDKYIQHNPAVADGLDGFGAAMKYFAENGLVMEYQKLHKVLGEGNFVLTMSEGKFGKGEQTAFYDLFRLEEGRIVEHWDVIAPIPNKEEWANNNGKW